MKVQPGFYVIVLAVVGGGAWFFGKPYLDSLPSEQQTAEVVQTLGNSVPPLLVINAACQVVNNPERIAEAEQKIVQPQPPQPPTRHDSGMSGLLSQGSK